MNWTKEQQQVIDVRNHNILVSAAAGSGKTAVLVERIIKMVTDPDHPVDIDRLLVVTFTQAAAAEMRERIANAIEKKAEQERDNLHLQKQMTLIHSAQITTIHSFCLYVIRNYFNQIDLDPGFRIADEAELRLMKSDVLNEVLEARYEEGDEKFLSFVESYAPGKTDAHLEKMVLKLYEFSMSYPQPAAWLAATKEAFDNASFMSELLEEIHKQIAEARRMHRTALAICGEGNGPYMYEDALLADQDILALLSECDTYEAYEKAFASISWKRLSAKKDETVDPVKREQVKDVRNEIKAMIQDIRKNFFYQSLDQSMEDMRKVRPVVEALISLTMDFMAALAAKKEVKNLLDFHDLEHFALKILKKDGEATQAAVELSGYFEEILVDEYQDSNYVQEELLNSISKEKFKKQNLFMVGDVKQSIYKFRLARPDLFLKKYENYQSKKGNGMRIDLQKNFRSRDSVIEGINCIFNRIMQKSLGGIAYDEKAALYQGADFPKEEGIFCGGKTELLLLDGKDELSEEAGARELEARAAAARIRELLEAGYQVYDKDHYRRAEYKDIVILLRSMSGWSEQFAAVFMEQGIPAYADTQTGYFSSVEVKDILNYLLIIDNPLQDIPFTAVLRSLIGNFSDEELSRIRIEFPEKRMYDSVKQYAESGENGHLRDKAACFLEQLQRLRARSAYGSVYDLLARIYKETGVYDAMSVLPGGAVRRGNLDMLLKKAQDFENTSYHGLFHFNRYIEKLHAYDIDYGEAMKEGREAVRIMSIHKSKGLEFPIVLLCGMGKMFNQQDARSRLLLHPDMGIGPDYVDYHLRTRVPTLLKKAMQKKIVLENLGEELRVLYVAMTRAKEKLIMTGFVKDREKKMKSWEKKENAGYRDLTGASCYFDWVAPVVLGAEPLFDVRCISAEELVLKEVGGQISDQEKKRRLLSWNSKAHLTEERKRELEGYLKYCYPYLREQIIKSKVSLSEWKQARYEEEEEAAAGLFLQEEREAYIPRFRKEKEEAFGIKRGNLYHKIMECFSFEKLPDLETIRLEIDRMIRTGRMKEEDKEALDEKRLLSFFRTGAAERMVLAAKRKQLYREQPFVLGVPAGRINNGLESGETVLIQGIIDAFFVEDGKLVLLDYKTDYVKSGEELIERYQTQLDFYQEALEQMTGRPVKEKLIYSFTLNKEIIC